MLRKMNAGSACWCGSNKPYGTCHMEFDRRLARERAAGNVGLSLVSAALCAAAADL